MVSNKPGFQMSDRARTENIEGGHALIIQHCCVYGDLPRKVRRFTVHPPRPYAQHPTSVSVSFIEPRRRNGGYFNMVPDDVRYLTIEQDGKIVYDSRSEVPCDMHEWRKSAARHLRLGSRDAEDLVADVKRDISEAVKVGIFTQPKMAKMLAYLDCHIDDVAGYRESMTIAEISDLISQLC